MIRIKEQIVSGIAAYPKALHLIWTNKLTKYLVLPVVLNIILVIAFIFSGVGIGDWINGIIERHTENMNGWIQAGMVAIKIVLPIIFFIVFIFIGGTNERTEVPGYCERGRVFTAAIPVLRGFYRSFHRGRFCRSRDNFTNRDKGKNEAIGSTRRPLPSRAQFAIFTPVNL